ncbi:MAG: FtsX-like permease family protein, partial [Kordiimonas sp.]
MEALRSYASQDVEEGVRLFQTGQTIIQDNNAFSEQITFADPSFFGVFDLPFVEGSANSSFTKPLDLLLTEEMAIKYFGRTDVVGETLTVCCMPTEPMDVQVSGVLKDLPENSHMAIDMLVLMDPSMFDFAPNILNTWTSVNVYTYFKLHEGSTAADLLARYNHWLDTESIFVERFSDGGKPTDMIKPNVMPLLDLHLHARKDAGNIPDMTPMGDITMVYTFSSVALLILVIASINFMNLSTARAVKRAREVALRKVLGASRLQVGLQFLGEAVAITSIALLFALVGVELALPLYSEVIGRDIAFSVFNDMQLLLSLVGITVLVGVISGSYPASYLSGFMPARILKANKSSDAGGAGSLRSMLVVFQFAISIGLAMCTAVVYGQTMYAKSMDVGYSHDRKLAVTSVGNLNSPEQIESMRQELEKIPGVTSAVVSSEVPSQDFQNNTGFTLLDGASENPTGDSVGLNYHSMGYGFFEAYDIKPIAGRTFDRAYGTDEVTAIPEDEDRIGTASIVLNESAVRALGITSPEEAIGKAVRASVFQAGTHDLTIIGVIPDIYFRSLKFGIRPTAYWSTSNSFRSVTISYVTNDEAGLLRSVEAVWREQAPLTPITHEFVSQMLDAQYASEDAQAMLFAAFSVLAILVACLGLFGLAAFTAEQRTKEIGIRKVLGATVTDIVRLLVWQFSRPV